VRGASIQPPRPSGPDLQQCRHHFGDQVHGLERTDHHLEVHDAALVVPAQHIHAVHREALDLHLELKNGFAAHRDLAHIAEGLVHEDLERRAEVHRRHSLSSLGRVDNRGVEHHRVGQQGVQAAGIADAQQFVPAGKGVQRHGSSGFSA